ncbi:MAG: hypothetical protein QOJ16_4534, partial [Acidobacteriota bacterium]|nr:hypothetical protein [Acidobacteriota bacterium]
MTPPDISSILPLRGTMVTLDGHSAAGTVLADQLVRLTNGAPIVIQGAVRRVLGSTVTVTGTASLLHVSNMNVTAIATPESAGISLVVYFDLIEGTPTATSWLFSKSFPELPPFLAGLASPKTASGTAAAPGPNLLDRLSLSDAQLVLASAAHPIDATTGAPLAAGLNFVAKCSPTGLLGLLGSMVSGGHPVLVYGPIVLPLPTQATLPMPQMPLLKFPWQLPEPIPGIQLTADLGIDQTFGKALRLHNVGLRLYCPPTRAWATANPSFNPILAATAKLVVPSAKLALDMTVLGLTGGSPMLFGQFEGVTVGALTQLADLAGGTDLVGYLPADLAKAVTALGKLSLLGMTLYLDNSLSLNAAAVTLGLPGINTQVLPGLALRQLTVSFSVVSPFGTDRAVSVELGGSATFLGAPFDVVLALPEVVASGRLTGSATLPLATLTQAVGLPAAPALTINELQFEMSKDGSYAVAAVLAERPPWTIDLGPVPLTLANLRLVAQHPKAGATSGTFSGVIALGSDLTLGFSYQSPGDFVLRGQLPDVGLLQLGSALTRQSVALPGGFDFALTDGSVLIQKSGNDLVFLYATTMAGLGTVAFEARRVGAGAWGFAAGIDLQGLRISGLPGLSALKPFEDVFHLDEILVVVASFADPAFQLPGLAAFDTPTIRSDNLQLPAGGVIAGLNIHARWTIDTSSRQQALLGKLLGLNPTLGVTLQVGKDPAADSRLYVSYDTTLQGHPFSCRFGLQMTAGQVSLFLLGTLQANIQGQPCRFDVVLLFVPNGAFISGSMLGSVQFLGVTLSNLAIVVGIDWEGLPSLGIAAEIAVDRFESSLAIFFDSTDPSRSMVAGSVSDLSLKDVVDTLAGSVLPSSVDAVLPKVALVGTGTFTVAASLAKALDSRQLDVISAAFAPHAKVPSSSSQVLFVVSKPGQEWFLTDMTTMLHYQIAKTGTGIQVSLEPQIYIVPNTTSIGALRFEQGFFLNSGLSLLSFQATAKVMVRPSQGILVDGSMDRIVIGTPALFSLTSADGKSGPRVSAATMSQPE